MEKEICTHIAPFYANLDKKLRFISEFDKRIALFEVYQVALESTSIYWIPIWRVLIEEFDLKFVNPLSIKQLPGRKSDVRDAH